MRKLKHLVISLLLPVSLTVSAEKPTFEQYVVGLKQEASQQGFSNQFIDQVFDQVSYLKRVVKADKNQPEFKETLDTYLPKRLPQWKVDQAREMYKENYELLTKIGKKYGVHPRFIVSIWGLETNFGRIQGKIPIINSLVTLSYDGRREAFFKKQLWASLTILDEGHISQDDFVGSWAGAMGQCQFIPSSFVAYAQDGDGDGKKDIWSNKADVFASIANYLKSEGWTDKRTWGRQVLLPDNFDESNIMPKNSRGRKQWLQNWEASKKPLSEWQKLGITRMNGNPLPNVDIDAVLIMPDDKKGRMFLAYNNYKTLMHWNRSYYFVTSVGMLADRITYPKIQL